MTQKEAIATIIQFTLVAPLVIRRRAALAQAEASPQLCLGASVLTMLGRRGQIIAVSDGVPTHYYVRFADGSHYWCHPGQFVGAIAQ